ncbi:23812_t:CDS:2, partial [Gigaspora margarita]
MLKNYSIRDYSVKKLEENLTMAPIIKLVITIKTTFVSTQEAHQEESLHRRMDIEKVLDPYYKIEARTDEHKMFDYYQKLAKAIKVRRSCKLWIKKVTELRRMIKQERENELEEKKVKPCTSNLKELFNDLNKALEIKPKHISALEKEENKVKKSPKHVDRNNLTERYESLGDNRKQNVDIDICAIDMIIVIKNKIKNRRNKKVK